MSPAPGFSLLNHQKEGLGDGSVGKNACHVSRRTWVWIPSNHAKTLQCGSPVDPWRPSAGQPLQVDEIQIQWETLNQTRRKDNKTLILVLHRQVQHSCTRTPTCTGAYTHIKPRVTIQRQHTNARSWQKNILWKKLYTIQIIVQSN